MYLINNEISYNINYPNSIIYNTAFLAGNNLHSNPNNLQLIYNNFSYASNELNIIYDG